MSEVFTFDEAPEAGTVVCVPPVTKEYSEANLGYGLKVVTPSRFCPVHGEVKEWFTVMETPICLRCARDVLVKLGASVVTEHA